MAGYQPLKITGFQTGLVKNREEFLLPDDAYPSLLNAYVWRERILRKNGLQQLGRLQRSVTIAAPNNTNSLLMGLEATATLVPGSIDITDSGAITWTDPNKDGVLVPSVGANGTVNYVTGIAIGPTSPNTGTFQYYPGLPVMGIRIREVTNSANDQTLFFDQKYAYIFNSTTNLFQEFITGTTWNKHAGTVAATDFFWSTNYWVSSMTIPTQAQAFFTTINLKLFWETNNTGVFQANADPPRITDGTTWYPFYDDSNPALLTPWARLDAAAPNPNWLVNFLSMLPYRGRMVTFNTWEGTSAATAINYSNRIRWSTIGNPFFPYNNAAAANVSKGSWRTDLRGEGGFLNIPTSEDIVSVGFVRDNLVIYCERSTWQLRYTGRSISPFQIERVNSELGGEGPFSAVQFDTSLVGIGDKGIIECDSYKSERIDIKIPDIVFDFQNANNGPFRVHGIRDFIKRLAYWTLPILDAYDPNVSSDSKLYPNRRLVYNYENDSWALFTDTFTCLGTFQPQSSRTWKNTKIPWKQCNFSWKSSLAAQIPSILGGNQQGFVMYLTVDDVTVNEPSLYISAITGSTPAPTIITVPNHNLVTTSSSTSLNNVPYIISISGIPTGTPFDNLNGGIFGIFVVDANNLALYKYNAATDQFNDPQTDAAATYIGGGVVTIRENFSIQSKKFNFLDEGQSIQLGYLDILMEASEPDNPGAITLKVFLDYDDDAASNIVPQNAINNNVFPVIPDTFFNSIIPTTPSTLNAKGGDKFWQRVYCATRANFLTLQYTFSNAQLANIEQTLDVQIDAQILWIRKSGRLTQI